MLIASGPSGFVLIVVDDVRHVDCSHNESSEKKGVVIFSRIFFREEPRYTMILG